MWHDDALPPVAPPATERLPRKVLPPDHSLLVTVTDTLEATAGDFASLLTGVAVDARMHLLPDDDVHLTLDLGTGNGFDIDPDRIRIGDQRLMRLDEVSRFVGLTFDLTGALGYWAAAQSIGNATDGDVIRRSAFAGWYQYDRLVNNGELDPQLLTISTNDDLETIGTLAGWAGAGDARASAALDRLQGDAGNTGRAVRDALRTSPPGAHSSEPRLVGRPSGAGLRSPEWRRCGAPPALDHTPDAAFTTRTRSRPSLPSVRGAEIWWHGA